VIFRDRDRERERESPFLAWVRLEMDLYSLCYSYYSYYFPFNQKQRRKRLSERFHAWLPRGVAWFGVRWFLHWLFICAWKWAWNFRWCCLQKTKRSGCHILEWFESSVKRCSVSYFSFLPLSVFGKVVNSDTNDLKNAKVSFQIALVSWTFQFHILKKKKKKD